MPPLPERDCPKCEKPFKVGEAIMWEILSDTFRRPTLVVPVDARCLSEVYDVFKGRTGDTGSQGPIGIQGPVGRTGREIKGSQGNPGADGTIGPVGPKGPQGIRGEVGHQGARGSVGVQGDVGPFGLPGDVGPRGLRGDDGLNLSPEMDSLRADMEHLRHIVGSTPLIGTVVCPECSKSWDLQNDLHLDGIQRAVFTCDCSTDLVVTGRGIQKRRG